MLGQIMTDYSILNNFDLNPIGQWTCRLISKITEKCGLTKRDWHGGLN